MSNNKKNKIPLKKLVDFIHDENNNAFYSSDESLKRFDDGLSLILKRANSAQAHSWINKAKGEISKFNEQLKSSLIEKYSKLSRVELLAEFKKESLGGLTFQHQFRNKKPEDLSEDELRSILEDQELLKSLNKQKGTPPDGSGEDKG